LKTHRIINGLLINTIYWIIISVLCPIPHYPYQPLKVPTVNTMPQPLRSLGTTSPNTREASTYEETGHVSKIAIKIAEATKGLSHTGDKQLKRC
jgi:hypothetical protein